VRAAVENECLIFNKTAFPKNLIFPNKTNQIPANSGAERQNANNSARFKVQVCTLSLTELHLILC